MYKRQEIDRIDYSNDTAAAVAKGPLSSARGQFAATGNADFGYFGAGYDDNPNRVSRVDRIDYANDTATASPKGPLSNTTMEHAASSGGANALPQ